MAKINGTDVKLYMPTEDIDNDSSTTTWKAVALAEESSLSVDVDLPDVTTKDSSGWAESISGLRSWNVSMSNVTDWVQTLAAGTPNARAFFAYILTRSTVKIAWGQDGYHFYGNAQISNLSLSSPKEDKVTGSFSLKGTSALAVTMDGTTDIDSSATYSE